MKTVILTVILGFSIHAHAETPWARDCVTFWGGDIPVAERTPENCKYGTNHHDTNRLNQELSQRMAAALQRAHDQGVLGSINTGGPTYAGVDTSPQVIITNGGNYVVTRSTATGRINGVITGR
jgi:hypothetical protein